MRRVQLAAAAVGAGILIATLFAGHAVAAQIGLSATFRASRIQVDTAPTTLKMPGPTTLTAIVEDWHGATIPKLPVNFTILSGPSKGKSLPAATTNSDGRATLSYSNSLEPGIDAVQASFTDGLEIHKSNRHFVLWLSGPPATAIVSPATIRVTPTCFQPAAAVIAASNAFKKVAPRTTPKPNPGPPQPEKTIANVTGENFNPFSAVLITFDAGPGGSPQSFEAQTDVFGHFSRDIPLTMPAEGLHLVRADDFRQREADATYSIPCFQPSVALDPPIGPRNSEHPSLRHRAPPARSPSGVAASWPAISTTSRAASRVAHIRCFLDQAERGRAVGANTAKLAQSAPHALHRSRHTGD